MARADQLAHRRDRVLCARVVNPSELPRSRSCPLHSREELPIVPGLSHIADAISPCIRAPRPRVRPFVHNES